MTERSAEAAEPWPLRGFLAALPERERRELLALGTTRRYERGSALMTAGEDGTQCFVVLRGFLKVVGENTDGNRALLAIRVPGDVVGEIAVLDGRPRSATVFAAVPTWARVIAGGQLLTHIAGHPVTALALQRTVTAKLRESTSHRTDLNGVPVLMRLARVVRRLASVYGKDTPEGVLIGAPLSQADLAELVGSTEQSVRRALSALREAGVISTRYRRMFVIDTCRLRAVAEGRTVRGGNPGVREGEPGVRRGEPGVREGEPGVRGGDRA
ncbi:Crp/Fnr family transcriptional regulator [Streptomyces sp. NPDC026659]|uniref:Crp/Fnr family transcriptional regulator n=1 Tax=Streptomyces sp. NPDC026659 TaxID=3155123 RepID=UPI0033DBAB05